MEKTLTLFALLIFTVAHPLHAADELESFDDARDLADQVMHEITHEGPLEGIELLRDYIVFPMAEFDQLKSQIDMQLPLIERRFGEPISYEFVWQDEVGSSLKRIVYIQKLERHALVWTFIFYRPRDTWMLNTFYFNDMLQEAFGR